MWQELKSNDPKMPNIFDLAVFDVEKIVMCCLKNLCKQLERFNRTLNL